MKFLQNLGLVLSVAGGIVHRSMVGFTQEPLQIPLHMLVRFPSATQLWLQPSHLAKTLLTFFFERWAKLGLADLVWVRKLEIHSKANFDSLLSKNTSDTLDTPLFRKTSAVS